jgi:ribosomal-protein-alanine N-acetyltransferase
MTELERPGRSGGAPMNHVSHVGGNEAALIDGCAAPVLPPGYEIRPLTTEDAPALVQAYSRNQDHLSPWEPRRSPEFYTTAWQLEDVTAKLDSAAVGQQDPWVIWSGEEVVGRVHLTNITRGVFQSASLGYWVDHRHTRRGLATAAARSAVQRATELGLHRIEAGTLPHNEASQMVLRRCGFERIGTAEDYLFIAGSWQDHVIFQKILHKRPIAPAER